MIQAKGPGSNRVNLLKHTRPKQTNLKTKPHTDNNHNILTIYNTIWVFPFMCT